MGNHPVEKNVTTSPRLFLKGKFLLEDRYDQFAIVTIVTKDIPPYSIYGGVPAKCIRMRFEQNQIDFLLKLKWWNMDEEWIRSNSLLFSDVNCLMEKYGISL